MTSFVLLPSCSAFTLNVAISSLKLRLFSESLNSATLGQSSGVNTLNFKINLFYYNASAVRVRNDLQALQVIVFYNIGEGCRYLITKRGVKFLLLEFVIDFAFARLSLRRLGNNK